MIKENRRRPMRRQMTALPLAPEERYGQQEGVLLVEAGGPTPRGVLGQEDDEDVEGGDGDDGEAPEDPERPVTGPIAAAGAGVGPAGQELRRGEERDEYQARQP